MSEEFDEFQLWYADGLAPNNTYAAQTDNSLKFQNDSQIKLDYCIPVNWSKRRTDLTGVQSDEGVYPDTGPAGAFVELQLTVDRTSVLAQDFIAVLINYYDILNTDSDFPRGRLGLTNTDNPQFDVTPVPTMGYRMIQFMQIDPMDNKGRQIYRILLQRAGK